MRNKITLIAIAIALFYVVRGTFFPDSVPVATRSPDASDACFISQKFVRQSLKAPASASFPTWRAPDCRARKAAGAWTVTSFVDAQNSFGATVRTDYVAQMTYDSDADKWKLLDLTFANR